MARRPARGQLVVLAVGVALLALVLLQGSPKDGPPLDPRSDGPLGTSALVRLTSDLGASVELSEGLPTAEDDVALVLDDGLDEDQVVAVQAWTRAGGTLVVTDPGSSFVPPAPPPSPFEEPEPLVRGRCDVEALADVEEVDGGAAVRFDAGTSRSSCFGSLDFAFVVVHAEGEGVVVSVGGAAFATNERLGRADNAVLAAALLVPRPGTALRFVDAPIPAGGGDKSLGDLVSDGLRRLGVQLAIAFLLYALWRAVRLGRPVAESDPVQVAGAELVAASGRLLERGRAPGPAAEILRERLRRAARLRLGVPASTSPTTLSEVVAAQTGTDPTLAAAALGDGPVSDDDQLVAVARAIATVHQEVLR